MNEHRKESLCRLSYWAIFIIAPTMAILLLGTFEKPRIGWAFPAFFVFVIIGEHGLRKWAKLWGQEGCCAMKPIDQAISDRVIARKRELMDTPPEELRKLPLYTPEPFAPLGKPQELGVYHDKTIKQEDIIVVQCKRTVFLGYGHMFAEGFILDERNQVRDAEENLMWDYR